LANHIRQQKQTTNRMEKATLRMFEYEETNTQFALIVLARPVIDSYT